MRLRPACGFRGLAVKDEARFVDVPGPHELRRIGAFREGNATGPLPNMEVDFEESVR